MESRTFFLSIPQIILLQNSIGVDSLASGRSCSLPLLSWRLPLRCLRSDNGAQGASCLRGAAGAPLAVEPGKRHHCRLNRCAPFEAYDSCSKTHLSIAVTCSKTHLSIAVTHSTALYRQYLAGEVSREVLGRQGDCQQRFGSPEAELHSLMGVQHPVRLILSVGPPELEAETVDRHSLLGCISPSATALLTSSVAHN